MPVYPASQSSSKKIWIHVGSRGDQQAGFRSSPHIHFVNELLPTRPHVAAKALNRQIQQLEIPHIELQGFESKTVRETPGLTLPCAKVLIQMILR